MNAPSSDFYPNRTRTQVQPGARSGPRERRTHRAGVQLLGAPGRSRSGALVEPQDGKQQQQQQQHLLKTSDGPEEYRNRPRWTRGPPSPSQTPRPRLPPPLLLSDKPEGSSSSEPPQLTSQLPQVCASSSSFRVSRAVAEEKPRATAAAARAASGSRKARPNQGLDFRTRLLK